MPVANNSDHDDLAAHLADHLAAAHHIDRHRDAYATLTPANLDLDVEPDAFGRRFTLSHTPPRKNLEKPLITISLTCALGLPAADLFWMIDPLLTHHVSLGTAITGIAAATKHYASAQTAAHFAGPWDPHTAFWTARAAAISLLLDPEYPASVSCFDFWSPPTLTIPPLRAGPVTISSTGLWRDDTPAPELSENHAQMANRPETLTGVHVIQHTLYALPVSIEIQTQSLPPIQRLALLRKLPASTIADLPMLTKCLQRTGWLPLR